MVFRLIFSGFYWVLDGFLKERKHCKPHKKKHYMYSKFHEIQPKLTLLFPKKKTDPAKNTKKTNSNGPTPQRSWRSSTRLESLHSGDRRGHSDLFLFLLVVATCFSSSWESWDFVRKGESVSVGFRKLFPKAMGFMWVFDGFLLGFFVFNILLR